MLALMVSLLVQSPPPFPVRTLDRGAASGIETARRVVVRTADEWASLWRAHAPARQAPAVDFSREMVVGVFLGGRTTAGYSVTVVDAAERDGVLVVRYVEKRPDPGAVTAQILTEPYHLAAVPRHPGEVRFEEIEQ